MGENTDSNGLGDLHEGFDLGWEPATDNGSFSLKLTKDVAMEGENVWPSDLTGFKETTLEY